MREANKEWKRGKGEIEDVDISNNDKCQGWRKTLGEAEGITMILYKAASAICWVKETGKATFNPVDIQSILG